MSLPNKQMELWPSDTPRTLTAKSKWMVNSLYKSRLYYPNQPFLSSDHICLMCHSGYWMDTSSRCHRYPIRLVNEFYSYFYGKTLRSRLSSYVPSNDGVYPLIRYCSVYKNYGDWNHGICVTCNSGMITSSDGLVCLLKPCEFCKIGEKITDAVTGLTTMRCIECEDNDVMFLNTNTSVTPNI